MGCMQTGAARFLCRALAMFLLPCSLARADMVADWNALALKTALSSGQDAADVARTMAMVHVAMFEVMNFVEGGDTTRFLVRSPGPFARSGEAAAAAAAHHVLRERFPAQEEALNAALERSLAPLPDERERANDRIWGRHLGANILAVWPSEAGARAPSSARHALSTLAAPGTEALASIAALNANVARFIDATSLKPIHRAKVHALVSMAVWETHGDSRIDLAASMDAGDVGASGQQR